MQLSEQWLREWVNPSVETKQLAHQLTMAGLEVGSIEPVAAAFSGVVVAEVIKLEPHPDADKLRVCSVNIGAAQPVQIVCGAANVTEGGKFPCATLGAVLPGEFTIKPVKLRGVPSNGMLCSTSELGLSESASGLMPLPSDAPVGKDIRDYLDLADHSLDIELTPNRGDCLSVRGIAREVGVLNQLDVQAPAIPAVPAHSDATLAINLQANAACPRYIGRVLTGINPQAQTPLWMQEQLRRSGLRSISPVVDVTNYVMLELGQPMHAFDLDTLDTHIVVRMANEGESLQLLDEQTITLNSDTLVIADNSQAIAMAGIMGGLATSVTDSTHNLFLESAFFTQQAIAGHAREYGLSTDSSHRFERGVDPNLQAQAMERATQLLLDIVGGTPGPLCLAESAADLPVRQTVALRAARLSKILGVEIQAETVTSLLSRLGLTVTCNEAGWETEIPSFRFDITREEDLIEEVARIYGYDNIPAQRAQVDMQAPAQAESQRTLSELADSLLSRGYHEAVTYSFTSPKIQSLLAPSVEPIALENPISAELSVMRSSLLAGLLNALAHNQKRQQPRVRLFESGLRFLPSDGAILQEPMLAAVAQGSDLPELWCGSTASLDFFDIKSDVEALLAPMTSSAALSFQPGEDPMWHPGQHAEIFHQETLLGTVGALHPGVVQSLNLKGPVFAFELFLNAIDQAQLPQFSELSKFPSIKRDLGLVVDKAITFKQIFEVISQNSKTLLKDLLLFDVYEGEGIDSSKKNLSVRLTLQSDSQTLVDEDVNTFVAGLLQALEQKLGATLRDW